MIIGYIWRFNEIKYNIEEIFEEMEIIDIRLIWSYYGNLHKYKSQIF